MDRLTHISLTNAIKEIDALKLLVISGDFSWEEIADFLEEISWNLTGVFDRRRYNSDEFQHRLRGLLEERKRSKEPIDDDR